MTLDSIHPGTKLGPVTLRVADLDRSIEFYTKHLGFSLIDAGPPEALLAAGDTHLLTLQEDRHARPASRTAGLYHFAILVPSRIDLALSLRQLVASKTPLQGFADHLVSEAIYLADPEGNGIEIYRDRPRDQWPRREGQLLMATDPLDVHALLDEAAMAGKAWAGLPPGTTIGHIHLQISDLESAVGFYKGTLGFDLVMRYGPSAAFLSAGGYHHHIGLNTWAGNGIPPAPPDATGLMWFAIELPDKVSYRELARRLAEKEISAEEQEKGLLLHDPSGIGLLLESGG
jgi:catechol 2,3-dioxygenase